MTARYRMTLKYFKQTLTCPHLHSEKSSSQPDKIARNSNVVTLEMWTQNQKSRTQQGPSNPEGAQAREKLWGMAKIIPFPMTFLRLSS